MMNDDGKNHRTHKKVTLLFLSFFSKLKNKEDFT